MRLSHSPTSPSILPVLLSLLWAYSFLVTATPLPAPSEHRDHLPRSSIQQTHTGGTSTLLSAKGLATLDSVRSKYNIQGVTLAVVGKSNSSSGNGNGWQNETYGLGVMDSTGKQVDDQTLFAIGSNSKLFTALSIGMLIENKTILTNGAELQWNTTLKDIFPGTDEWEMVDTEAEGKIAMLDVLTMRSGVPRHDIAHGRNSTPADVLYQYRYLRPSAPLASTWQYSNGHYFILSHIVANLSGIPFIDFVKQHILDPVGLKHTYYNATEAAATGHRAEGFFRTEVDKAACVKGFNETGQMAPACLGQEQGIGWWIDSDGINEAGAGGIATCSSDMTIWLQELLEPKVLNAATLNQTEQPIMPMNVTATFPELGPRSYGFGTWTYTYRGIQILEHGGGIPGFVSLLVRVPSRNIAYFINSNDPGPGSGTGEAITALSYGVLDDLLGLDPIDWDSRIIETAIKTPSKSVPTPASPAAPPSADKVVGLYSDPAYGEFQLSRVSPQGSANGTGNSNDTAQIATVLDTLAKYPSVSVNLTGDVYVAPLYKVFGTYIVFTPYDGPGFIWTTVIVKPITSQPGQYAVFTQGVGMAVIVPGGGIGMFGNFWGGVAGKTYNATSGEAVDKQSEVWFAKVQ